ncbi:MAG: [FeFe] hydrogenase H-cluster maturation GTPase HydF [Deltaproteobacteria bacterium]|nr:[FeFe] hydrogenase H-cluster maturation GTPase HydF [Deltaproteobacteria bacterium]
MNNTPSSNRTHIGFFGRRNTGKSSLMNALIGQDYSIVSDVAGTTTDVVSRAFELQPVGPVVFHDTAGVDDEGELGLKRVSKTSQTLERCDLVLLVNDSDISSPWEEMIVSECKRMKKPFINVRTKTDISPENCTECKVDDYPYVSVCVPEKTGIEKLRSMIVGSVSRLSVDLPLVSDLVKPHSNVMLVIPIDREAPKGRLILPQMQVMRELLDSDVVFTVTKEQEIGYALKDVLKDKPDLVITDSQVFLKVDGEVPPEIPLTGFSVLYARAKGDLREYVAGLNAIDNLKEDSRILIAENCSHRPVSEDIGRVKIPRWLRQYTGLNLNFDVRSGNDFPVDLSPYDLVIQCGGCMVNRQLVVSRIQKCRDFKVPVTNYGLTIAFLHGIIRRALSVFPDVLEEYLENQEKLGTGRQG